MSIPKVILATAAALVITVVTLFALWFGGVIGTTYAERKVFEHSYQRSESIKSQIATDEAALAEINAKLKNPNLDEDTKFNLKAQATAARMRIDAAKRRMK